MKATELMIGDWVIKPSGHTRTMSREEFSNDDAWFEDTKPIPLTAEILEKNGITLLEVGDNSVSTPKMNLNRFEKWFIHTQFTDTYLWYDRRVQKWNLHNMSGARFRYVHELQHLLRLCSLSDLADNFKI